MRILLAISLALSLGLAGCEVFIPKQADIPVSQDLPPAGQAAQKAINEANVAIVAAYLVIGQNAKERIWTKEQAQGYHNKVTDTRRRVDDAQRLVDLGEFGKGKTEAEAAQALLIILHREIAAQARKEAK